MKHVATLAIAMTLGCGGGAASAPPSNSADPASSNASAAGVYGGAEYGGYHRTPELTAFHDLIADKTTPAACAASKEISAAAAAIAKAPSPQPDPEGMWSNETNELAGIAEDFVTNCAGTDAGAIEYDVASLHRSFQRLLLQLHSP